MSWVSVGVSVGSALFGSRKAKKAAKVREAAYRDAGQIVDASYNEAAGYFEPRAAQERAAMEQTNALLGLGGEAPDYSLFRDTPGYQYAVDEGQRAIERSAAARGGLASGNTLLELQRHAQGMADLNFNSYLDRVLGLQSQGVDNALAQLMLSRGTDLANLRLGAGGARAGGIEGSAAAITGGLNTLAPLLGDRFGGNAVTNALVPITPGVAPSTAYRPTVPRAVTDTMWQYGPGADLLPRRTTYRGG